MKILYFDRYLDGGTVTIHTDEGEYCFDERIGTETTGQLWKGYPGRGHLIEDDTQIVADLLEALQHTFDGQQYINYINTRK